MQRAVVLYDPDCGVCRWLLSKFLAWDRRRALRPVPLGSPESDELLAGMPREIQMSSWHVIPGAGEVRSAGGAATEAFGLLSGGRALAALTARLPGATERAYRLVAGNRSRLGRLVTDGAKRRADARIAERAGG